MRLRYKDRKVAEEVRDALRIIVGPVFDVSHQPDEKGYYYVDMEDELKIALELTAMAFPRLSTRQMLFEALRSVIRKGEA